MTVQDAPGAPARLSFGAAFRTTFATVFGHLWSFVKAALLPIVIGILLAVASFMLLAAGQANSAAEAVLEILGLLPLVILGIASSRLALIGTRAGAIPRPLFGRRTLVYLGYTVLFGIVLVLPVMASAVVLFGIVFNSAGADAEALQLQNPAMIGAWLPLLFLFYLVYLYFVLRFALVFPAVAVDRKLGLAGSWRLTRGAGGFKLYALLIVIVLLCMVVTLIATLVVNALAALLWFTPGNLANPESIDWMMVGASAAPTALVGLLAEFFSFLLLTVAVTTAYAQLSGWGAPREEILERFE